MGQLQLEQSTLAAHVRVATVARDADPSLDPLRTLTMLLQFGGTRHADGTRGAGRTAEG